MINFDRASIRNVWDLESVISSEKSKQEFSRIAVHYEITGSKESYRQLRPSIRIDQLRGNYGILMRKTIIEKYSKCIVEDNVWVRKTDPFSG
jgi:hypothetical protein